MTTRLPKAKLNLKSPVGLAAGFDKDAKLMDGVHKFAFGFSECGTVTPEPQSGNSSPRIFRLTEDEGIVNRMGFPSEGLEKFVARLRRKAEFKIPVGANVGANKASQDFISDYEEGIEAVYPYCSYITINISSPNTPGLRSLQNKLTLQDLLERCAQTHKKAAQTAGSEVLKPVFLKIAPDLDEREIGDIIETVREEGAWLSGLVISNTTLDRPNTLRSSQCSEAGGLSGKPLFEKSTRILREIATELAGSFDLIGCGGITSGADVYDKIRAGANAVQLYSALVYHGPGLVAKINSELAECLKADGFNSVEAAVGADLPSRA